MRPDSLAERTGSFHPSIAAQIRATDALKLELNELGARAGTLIEHSQRTWQSITFSGTRHRLHYAFEGEEAVFWGEALIAVLDEHEFSIPHQLVADGGVVDVNQRLEPPRLEVTLELLLLDTEG